MNKTCVSKDAGMTSALYGKLHEMGNEYELCMNRLAVSTQPSTTSTLATDLNFLCPPPWRPNPIQSHNHSPYFLQRYPSVCYTTRWREWDDVNKLSELNPVHIAASANLDIAPGENFRTADSWLKDETFRRH
jgi:hypothetical protein